MTLLEAKDRVSDRLLGEWGVHAVGVHRQSGAVRLYFDVGTEEDAIAAAVATAQRCVGPAFTVEAVRDDPSPRAFPSGWTGAPG